MEFDTACRTTRARRNPPTFEVIAGRPQGAALIRVSSTKCSVAPSIAWPLRPAAGRTRLGTESLQTRRWKELDSKFQYAREFVPVDAARTRTATRFAADL